ncbi:MAG: ABC transporter permease [Leptolinea sp.]|jgi:putative ABC transport system permease protein|nr:ABC transporter permease [Leptolinea sp.]
MGFYLAVKEVWRNRGRFILISLVIALITTLVLFIAALAEGLAQSNREYLSKVDADLFVFQKDVDRLIATSRISRTKINDIRRVEGVKDVGALGFATGTFIPVEKRPTVNVSLIGIEPDSPGMPPVLAGRTINTLKANEAVVDQRLITRYGVEIGDEITVKTIQGTKEKFFTLQVVGHTDGQQYQFAPTIFLPFKTWDQIRPQALRSNTTGDLSSNIFAVKLTDPESKEIMAARIQDQVDGVEVIDKPTTIDAVPGYKVQQNTLNTQQGFTLLIGVLVIGGFFQIQLLQKIPLIGVLKAIGSSNLTIAVSVIAQIVVVTTFGVFLGSAITLLLSIALPAGIPIVFNGTSVLVAILALLAIGPAGGLVSVRVAIQVEPLIALGLSS